MAVIQAAIIDPIFRVQVIIARVSEGIDFRGKNFEGMDFETRAFGRMDFEMKAFVGKNSEAMDFWAEVSKVRNFQGKDFMEIMGVDPMSVNPRI